MHIIVDRACDYCGDSFQLKHELARSHAQQSNNSVDVYRVTSSCWQVVMPKAPQLLVLLSPCNLLVLG